MKALDKDRAFFVSTQWVEARTSPMERKYGISRVGWLRDRLAESFPPDLFPWVTHDLNRDGFLFHLDPTVLHRHMTHGD